MSGACTHYAAVTLARAASRLGELGCAIDRGEASLELVRLRLDTLRQDLDRDALEYEQMAASEYITEGADLLTDRDPGGNYPAEVASCMG